MNVSKPQSVPAWTFSRPTTSASRVRPLGDEPRVLDRVDLDVDHAEDQVLAVGQVDLLEDLPLVRVARVGALDVERPRVRLQDRLDDVPQRHVLVVRAGVVAPAHVQADLLLGDAVERRVQRVDRHRQVRVPALDRRADGPAVRGHREVGRVDLQVEPGVGDRLVLVAQRLAERLEVLLVRAVVLVGEVEGDLARG
jgi:hypothetical protein